MSSTMPSAKLLSLSPRRRAVLAVASAALGLGLTLTLSACGTSKGVRAQGDNNSARGVFYTQTPGEGVNMGGLFGKNRSAADAGQNGIGVNSYLWRATLDTLSFMPLTSADPWGGVIITDWFSNPEKPDERFKATVYILDTRLRADALNVTVYKQIRDGSGGWADSAVSAQTETDLENSILTRARQLRLANVAK